MKRRVPHLAAALLIAAVWAAGGLEPLERHMMDARFRVLRTPASGDVVLVAIDPASLGTLSVWPWPRGYHATVLENLLAAGARTVAFDLDFSSPSHPEEDATFAEAIAAAGGRVVLPVFRQWQHGGAGGPELFGSMPLPDLAIGADLASINIRPEDGGMVRRYLMRDVGPAGEVPSLGAALAGATARDGEEAQAAAPPREDGEFWIDFGIAVETIPRISYADILTRRFRPDAIAGRAVIVGATAVELGDQVPVPVHATLPGPVLQALAAESIVQGRTMQRVAAGWIAAALLLSGWFLGPRIERSGWRLGLLGVAAGAALLAGTAMALQARHAVLVDTSPLAIGLASSWALGLARRTDRLNLRLIVQALKARRVEHRMRHVVRHSFEAIVTIGEDGRIESFNPAAREIFGLEEHEAIGSPFARLLFGPGDGAEPASVADAAPREVTGVRADGAHFPLELADTTFEAEGRRLRVAFMRDITHRRAQQRALEHQATHDALTGLPNRVLLHRRCVEALDAAQADGTPAAVLILDLDRFKEVNDTLGHQVGDRLLQQIAMRLRDPLRPVDTIARLGGDEFAILLPGVSMPEARAMAAGLIGRLEDPFRIDGLGLQVDASVGIAMYPDHGSEAAVLIQRGDVAMYVAKKVRNTVAVYDPEQDFHSVRHLTLKGELRQAIDRDELVLYYQPKISSATGRADGAEALMRWRHPRHGLVPPGEFIPLAEHTGLIKPMTQWALDAAMRQCAAWRKLGLDLPISVNCSARNLLEEDLPGTIEQALRRHGLDPRSLILEITETAIIEDPQGALEVLTLLAGLGVRISIDDFGTGYSSMEYLTRLPASELKIDRSFVMGILREENNAIIVRSIIDLAHNLGLRAVAEGVDSEEAWQVVRSLGCDASQGFHFARPIDAAEFVTWARTSRWGCLTSEAQVIRA